MTQETKYLEKDFQKEIILGVEKLGFQKKTYCKYDLMDKSFDKNLLFKFLRRIYKDIDQQEINEIEKSIEKQLNGRDYYENNKIAFFDILKNGITTEKTRKLKLPAYKLIDYEKIDNNVFTISEEIYIHKKSRIDVAVFINGLPVYILELKSIFNDNATLENAITQLKTYLIHDNEKFCSFNIAQIVAKNYQYARMGAIHEEASVDKWFNVASSSNDATSFFDIFEKKRIINYIRWGVLFGKSWTTKTKYILKHHQYQAVLNTINALKKDKGGYIWHTQGAGKTISMVALIASFIQYQGLSSFTTIIDVDRRDLISNISKTIKSIDKKHFANTDIETMTSGSELKLRLSSIKYRGVIITTTQKFGDWDELSDRKDIIIISDEAHRTHNEGDSDGITYFEKLNTTLPHAIKLGFTGTPIFDTDKSTFASFGECLHQYNMKQAEDDGVIVKIAATFHHAPLKTIDKYSNDTLAKKAIRNKQRIISMSPKRNDHITNFIANKFKEERSYHESTHNDTYKIMVVTESIEQGYDFFKRLSEKIYNGKKEKIAFIATHDQNRKDWESHKYLNSIKNNKKDIYDKFSKSDSKYEILVVTDMLLTGYNVPNLRMMFFDKKIQKHNLLQAIARVNRKFDDKEKGFVWFFRDVKKELEESLMMYRQTTNDMEGGISLSNNANEDILKLFDVLRNKHNIIFENMDWKMPALEANKFLEKWRNNRDIMKIVFEIVDLSSLILKWQDKNIKKWVILCKNVCQAKKMGSGSYVNISKEEFDLLTNMIRINTKLIKDVHYATLEDLFKAPLSQNGSANYIFKKLKNSIMKTKSLTEDESKTLIEQLKEIIAQYNKNNLASENAIKEFEESIKKLGGNLNPSTQILIKHFKEIMNKSLSETTINKIETYMIDLPDNWENNVSSKKNVKKDLRKIIIDEEKIEKLIVIQILSESFKEEGMYG